MPSTFSPNKLYELMATGEKSGTWGTVANTNVFSIIDSNLGGRLSKSVDGNTNVTITDTEAKNLYQTLTGVLTGNIQYIVPKRGSFYLITNSTTGAFTITVIQASGTGVVIPQGSTALVFVNPDGTPAVTIPENYLSALTLAAALPVASGGTGGVSAAAAMANLGTAVTLTAGTGLTGGGDISTSRSFAFANVADTTILANISGISAPPIPHLLTDIIDNTIGNTQGDILYRDAAAWAVLAPGTAGLFLKTGGAAANPSWASAAVAGFFGNCQFQYSSGTVVKLMPYQGNSVTFPSGAVATIGSGGISSTITNASLNGTAAQTLTANTLYYAYLWDSGGGTYVIDWSATGHATDTTSGIEIKSGDATRVLVGWAYPQAGPIFVDSVASRLVGTWFNRKPRQLSASFSTTRSTTSASLVELNTEIRVQFLSWGDAFYAAFSGSLTVNSGTTATTSLGLDGTTGFTGTTTMSPAQASPNAYAVSTPAIATPSEGFHYATVIGASAGGVISSWLSGGSLVATVTN